MHVLIVVPTFEEEGNIEKLINDINFYLEDKKYSVLVVDDNSKDNTAEIVKNMQKAYDNLYLLQRSRKLGLASAYIDGFKYGIGLGCDAFIEMDADYSHDPKYLSKMFDMLIDNDVVIASRNIQGGKVLGWGLIRNLISKGGSLYSKLILNCPINDLTGGYNGWKLNSLVKIGLDSIISKGYSFQIEMKYRAYKKGCKIVEFPIIFEDRKIGKSKMSKRIFIEAFLNVIKIKFMV